MNADALLQWADAVHQFIIQWALFESAGEVDSFGGEQFRRVLGEFVMEAEPPWDAESFINEHKLDNPNQ